MRRLAALVAMLLVAVLVGGCGATSAAPDRLPDATLQPLRADGTAVHLRELKGPLVVSMWANWCTQCRTELPILEAFHRKHSEVTVLGVDWQDPARSKALQVADRAGLTYPLVVDSEPVLHAQGLPRLLLVDADGAIAYAGYPRITSLAGLERLVDKHLEVAS